MRVEKQKLANWGLYPTMEAEIAHPQNMEEARTYLLSQNHLIARGNGRCYGDAALGTHVLSTLALNRVLSFDTENGLIACEAGVLLSDLLPLIVPKGWFFHVTPGTKNITVGGAIASDVHGKNHLTKGCFSNYLLYFDLMDAEGRVLRCSRTEHADLFWQTCGGMGWTGVILSAAFQLMPLPSTQMRQFTVKARHLSDLFNAFEEYAEWPYVAGWIDCLPTGRAFGRGLVYFGEHMPMGSGSYTSFLPQKPRINVPFFAPHGLLNPLSIWAHNAWRYHTGRPGERTIDLETYFYPLDGIGNWNRLYGRRGFVQYQFCIPERHAETGIPRVLETIQKSQDVPFLTVLKRHGDRAPENIHAFPFRGYSLALDFPRTRTILDLVRKLDDILLNVDAKIYLSKDSSSNKLLSNLNPTSFGDPKFESALRARLNGHHV